MPSAHELPKKGTRAPSTSQDPTRNFFNEVVLIPRRGVKESHHILFMENLHILFQYKLRHHAEEIYFWHVPSGFGIQSPPILNPLPQP